MHFHVSCWDVPSIRAVASISTLSRDPSSKPPETMLDKNGEPTLRTVVIRASKMLRSLSTTGFRWYEGLSVVILTIIQNRLAKMEIT